MEGAPTSEAAAAPGLRDRLRRWLAGRGLRQWWKAGLAVVLAVAALFGGLDTVDTSVTAVKPGTAFADGQFTITVERARSVTELRAGRSMVVAPATPGIRYLGVVGTIRNDGTIPGRLQGALDVREPSPAQFFAALRLTDGTRVVTLGPGLQEEVAFVWKVPDSALPPGASAVIRMWHKTFRQGYVTYGEQWIPSLTEYGRVELPIGEAA